jgi:hypothetical protein
MTICEKMLLIFPKMKIKVRCFKEAGLTSCVKEAACLGVAVTATRKGITPAQSIYWNEVFFVSFRDVSSKDTWSLDVGSLSLQPTRGELIEMSYGNADALPLPQWFENILERELTHWFQQPYTGRTSTSRSLTEWNNIIGVRTIRVE